VFLLLFICQVCFSSRVPRQSDVTTETPSTTAKTDAETEEFNKMKLELEKHLDENEKRQLNEIIQNITTANTIEQGINGALQLIALGIVAGVREAETPTSTPAPA